MLILTRKVGESIDIGDGVKITILDLKGGRVRIGLDTPKDVKIVRSELKDPKDGESTGQDIETR